MSSRSGRVLIMGVLSVTLMTSLPPSEAAEWQYKAQRGDTPLRICRHLSRSPGCSLALARLNAIPPRAPIPPGTTVRIPAGWLKEPPIVGGVLESSEGAAYQPVDGAEFAPLVAGEPVYLGDTIRTTDGTAVLEFVSGLMIEIRPHSVLVLQSVVDLADAPVVNVDLASGEATVASGGDADSGLAGDFQPGQDLIASAERLLEEQPAAAGIRQPAAGAAKGGRPGAEATLARLALDKGRRNSFVPARIEWTADPLVHAWQIDVLALPRRLDLMQRFSSSTPRLELPDLEPGCYEVRIRPVDPDGRALDGKSESLCVHPTLQAPVMVDLQAVSGHGLRIAWEGVDHASGYLVEAAADREFLHVEQSWRVASPSLDLPSGGPQAGYLRVRALNAADMAGPPGAVLELAPDVVAHQHDAASLSAVN